MPRKIDPGTIGTGPGFSSADTESTDIGGASPGLSGHVGATQGAHPASAITIDDIPPTLDASTVEEALDALASLVPPVPPKTGNFSTLLALSGIPDWGVLKLGDMSLTDRFSVPVSFPVDEIYGYWYQAPEPADEDPPFTVFGADPQTDPTFNIADGTYTGGGLGESVSGAFTRDVGGPNPITETLRILPSSGGSGGKGVVVSGAVYPADKGVLALIHWPAGGDVSAFLAQDLTDRCPAAILLGQGVTSTCDGLSGGGMFDPGAGGDPFAFPGKATGQYDLSELHTALSTIDGSALPFAADTTIGQVRLGTDPNAGEPVVAGGIPILGGTSVATGGGDDNNFFRYRLPYLEDYASLEFTPTGEAPRYFLKPTLALNAGTDLTEAGDYGAGFTNTFYQFQLARYRHRFTMDDALLAAGEPRENGAYMLLHFKKEATFEALVRDGSVPADDDLYSANLSNWADPEDLDNLIVDSEFLDFPAVAGYHVLRSSIFEDPDGTTDPTVTAAQFDYTTSQGNFVRVSGIGYQSTFRSGSLVSNDFEFTGVTLTTDPGFFEHTYRTREPGRSADARLANMNPIVLNIAPFSWGEDGGSPNHSGGAITDVESRRRQRLELNYNDIQASAGGVADGPLPADGVSYTFTNPPSFWRPTGDLDNPGFSRDAKIRAHFRRPLGNLASGTAVFGESLALVGGDTLLTYTSRNDGSPVFGNFTSASGPQSAGAPLASLVSAYKDVTERFLDEVYRWRVDFIGVPAGDRPKMLGPGLPGGTSFQDLPVRVGNEGAPWNASSYMETGAFLLDLATSPDVSGEAQITGFPDRSPDFAVVELVRDPFPSAGMLVYPRTDYTTGHRPNSAIDAVTQFDYSGIPGTGDRSYVRAFDVAFSRDASPVSAEGTQQFTIRVRGLTLADFAYAAPGPGTTAVAIMIKVPGLTTWMDLGRNDGDGPSKQDAFLDGAGCKVVGPSTFDAIDETTHTRYCEVRVNVGPAIVLTKNSFGEVPIFVKVIMKDSVAGRDLDFTQVGPTGNALFCRAVVGLEIVHP